MKEKDLLNLIKGFQNLVSRGEKMIIEKYDLKISPLEANKKKIIPKSGVLDREKNITFDFHGAGCLLKFENDIVDFDYGPDFRTDGFTPWQIKNYIDSLENIECSLDDLKTRFKVFEEEGLLIQPKLLPNSGLFFFTEDF